MAFVALVTLALAASGRKKAAAKPDDSCIVTSTLVDGTVEKRDCYLLGDQDTKQGTKAKFQSCTQ